jgi:hypothetical protein
MGYVQPDGPDSAPPSAAAGETDKYAGKNENVTRQYASAHEKSLGTFVFEPKLILRCSVGDLDPDPYVSGPPGLHRDPLFTRTDLAPDPSIIKQKWFLLFCNFFYDFCV